MELHATNFECFPTGTPAHELLGPLVKKLESLPFSFTIGSRNSNQLTYDFDRQLEAGLHGQGAEPSSLILPRGINQRPDFVFTFGGRQVVVEVEKANWEKILRDLLKFHLYFKHGADFAILFLPRGYPHSSGESQNFKTGRVIYQQCLDWGFGVAESFARILLVGYDQHTSEGHAFTSAIRNGLKTAGKLAMDDRAPGAVEASTAGAPTDHEPVTREGHRPQTPAFDLSDSTA